MYAIVKILKLHSIQNYKKSSAVAEMSDYGDNKHGPKREDDGVNFEESWDPV